ncbi:MAG: hypothetical protein DIZ80_08835 [endosymbiont of Galathealinum brachiosum]|uniref:DUF560 domain-containing protein n=1 Tax=endosymbiont of Galathealinum brachiosum TaxID=2200906 RepID=A0A370DCT3_9GAMM|nr:MAG: hypothetical protein DIZ80_08835 [endosymbiont of Galathealinum brachiosum]
MSTYAAETPYSFNLNTGLLYDDNVARATLEQDIVGDTIANLGVMADYRFHQSHESIIILSTAVDAYQYQDFDKLSNILVSAKADYQIQPNHGFTAPWYHVSLEYSIVNYQSTLRDSDGLSFEIGMGKRLNDRIKLRSGLIYENFEAEADEFDIDNYRFYFSLDFQTHTHNTFYMTLGYNDGNVATSTTDSTPAGNKPLSTSNNKISDIQLQSHHLPNEIPGGPLRVDDAFQNGFVYQLDTKAITLQLGNNYALSSNQSIDASLFYYSTDDSTDANYNGIIAQLSYLHRF